MSKSPHILSIPQLLTDIAVGLGEANRQLVERGGVSSLGTLALKDAEVRVDFELATTIDTDDKSASFGANTFFLPQAHARSELTTQTAASRAQITLNVVQIAPVVPSSPTTIEKPEQEKPEQEKPEQEKPVQPAIDGDAIITGIEELFMRRNIPRLRTYFTDLMVDLKSFDTRSIRELEAAKKRTLAWISNVQLKLQRGQIAEALADFRKIDATDLRLMKINIDPRRD